MTQLIKNWRNANNAVTKSRIALEIESELCAARFAEYSKGNVEAGRIYFF